MKQSCPCHKTCKLLKYPLLHIVNLYLKVFLLCLRNARHGAVCHLSLCHSFFPLGDNITMLTTADWLLGSNSQSAAGLSTLGDTMKGQYLAFFSVELRARIKELLVVYFKWICIFKNPIKYSTKCNVMNFPQILFLSFTISTNSIWVHCYECSDCELCELHTAHFVLILVLLCFFLIIVTLVCNVISVCACLCMYLTSIYLLVCWSKKLHSICYSA